MKKPKPVRAWGIVELNGSLSKMTYTTRATARWQRPYRKVIRVEIRPVKSVLITRTAGNLEKKMDIQTGKIYGELKEALREVPKERLLPMMIPPTRRQMVNGKVGRNDLCPCGSGRKFKKCCLVPDTCPLPKEPTK
jgi:hypothetical protein